MLRQKQKKPEIKLAASAVLNAFLATCIPTSSFFHGKQYSGNPAEESLGCFVDFDITIFREKRWKEHKQRHDL
jgi:adenosylmethionine-8-amino-7-oxononanoate aminotransferase